MYFFIASSLDIPIHDDPFSHVPFKAFQAFHLAFSYNNIYIYQPTVKENIPGAGILQSPMVACLNKAYPANLSSLVGVLAGVQVRTKAAVSSNFF